MYVKHVSVIGGTIGDLAKAIQRAAGPKYTEECNSLSISLSLINM